MDSKKDLKKILFNHSGTSVELFVNDTLYKKVLEEPSFGTELLFKAMKEKKNSGISGSKTKDNESSVSNVKNLNKLMESSDRRKWDDDSVVLLLTTILSMKDEFKVALKRKKAFRKVHKILLSQGLTFTFQDMMKKYQNLMQTYRRVRLKLETEGEGRYSWPYFELIHELDSEIKSYLMEKHLLLNPGAEETDQEWSSYARQFVTNSPSSSCNGDAYSDDDEEHSSHKRLKNPLPLIEDEEVEWKGDGLKRKLNEIEDIMYSGEKKSRSEESYLDKLDQVNSNLIRLNDTFQRIEGHLGDLFKVIKKKIQL